MQKNRKFSLEKSKILKIFDFSKDNLQFSKENFDFSKENFDFSKEMFDFLSYVQPTFF